MPRVLQPDSNNDNNNAGDQLGRTMFPVNTDNLSPTSECSKRTVLSVFARNTIHELIALLPYPIRTGAVKHG